MSVFIGWEALQNAQLISILVKHQLAATQVEIVMELALV